MKTANLSIVFTDIKGFTERTSNQTLEENQRLLQRHNELLAPLFKAFGGRIIKMIGDAFLVTFESPTQSVLCGVAIQDRLWLYNRTVHERERFDVRVAINAGEVRLEDNDVFGEPVNIASRVEGIAEAGEVFFTEAVYLAMNKAEVPSEEVGQFELKGIPGKVRVFRVPRAPYRVEAPAETGPGAGEAMPPYGNLGLSKLPDEALRPDVAAKAAAIGSRAVSMGGDLMDRTGTALNRLTGGKKLPVSPKLLGAVGVVALGLIAFAALSGSGVQGAIDDVRGATGREREKKVEIAKQEIGKIKDSAKQAYFLGQLEEAQNRMGMAISYYEDAARAGHKRAGNRIIDLLEHPTCNIRAAAASAAGGAKLNRAKSELEDLAQHGGPDEGVDIPLIGCNSKAAAQRALRELERGG